MLRRWQLALASLIIILIATSAGFFFYARHRARKLISTVPSKLPGNIAQRAVGFSYSKSEAGRTLFTIKADEVVQFKDNVHAELHRASITVFGRTGDRYDQIYADQFSYDQKTQEVRADGPVEIDLESNPKTLVARPDQAPPDEIRNPLHLKTSGLVFSQQTGIAHTDQRVEVTTPQGIGSAVGATYDTHSGVVRFEHDVRLTSGDNHIEAASATAQQNPERIIRLEQARVTSPGRELSAPELAFHIRQDNTVDRVLAPHGFSTSTSDTHASANSAILYLAAKQQLTRAELSGNVRASAPSATLQSNSADLHFADNHIATADLRGNATVRQSTGSDFSSDTLHLDFAAGKDNALRRASSEVPATVHLAEPAASRNTVINADKMNADFDSGALSLVHAAPKVRIASQEQGKPARNSTADSLDAHFTSVSGKATLAQIIETGNVHLNEGTRTATAQRAEYTLSTRTAVLTGAPRLTDSGASLSADRVEMPESAQNATATGNVRLTYTGSSTTSEPTHAVADSATMHGDTIQLTGSPVRLWQATNVVLGPKVDFNRQTRAALVTGTPQSRATAELVQQSRDGSLTPVTITSNTLDYSDAEHRSVFSGNVLVRGSEGTLNADKMTVTLAAANANSRQIQTILASGNVHLQQPGRRGTGSQLVYTAKDASYRLTGTPDAPPSIFSAELGNLTGDSLTFFSRDDRVLVESQGNRILTRTYVNANPRDRRNQ